MAVLLYVRGTPLVARRGRKRHGDDRRTNWIIWQAAKKDLLLPIIYVRGFAMSQGEIDYTTADPFNGFNVGSVLVRTGWTGDAARHIFELPVLRLTQPPQTTA